MEILLTRNTLAIVNKKFYSKIYSDLQYVKCLDGMQHCKIAQQACSKS